MECLVSRDGTVLVRQQATAFLFSDRSIGACCGSNRSNTQDHSGCESMRVRNSSQSGFLCLLVAYSPLIPPHGLESHIRSRSHGSTQPPINHALSRLLPLLLLRTQKHRNSITAGPTETLLLEIHYLHLPPN